MHPRVDKLGEIQHSTACHKYCIREKMHMQHSNEHSNDA